jgi:hypothetical protein
MIRTMEAPVSLPRQRAHCHAYRRIAFGSRTRRTWLEARLPFEPSRTLSDIAQFLLDGLDRPLLPDELLGRLPHDVTLLGEPASDCAIAARMR